MAVDEVLLRTTRSTVLRFYRWDEPSVSFGYFDKFEEANAFAGDRALVRRWTGGGIVPHGDDLTYSLMICADEPAYRLSSRELYQRIHEMIAATLLSRGVETQLVTADATRVSAACFANPVAADLLEGNRKIAGAAQRKTRNGLLHQGSIQRPDLDDGFREAIASALTENLERQQILTANVEVAEKVAREKYATEAWLRRR